MEIRLSFDERFPLHPKIIPQCLQPTPPTDYLSDYLPPPGPRYHCPSCQVRYYKKLLGSRFLLSRANGCRTILDRDYPDKPLAEFKKGSIQHTYGTDCRQCDPRDYEEWETPF